MYTLTLNGKDVVVLGDHYNGSPLLAWKYDILIAPKGIISQFEKEIFFAKHLNDGWNPRVIEL